MRIVSLLPSATEILFALGVGDDVVGVTHECDYPPDARKKPHLTRSSLPAGLTSAEIDRHVRTNVHSGSSLYALDADLLERLAPDLIVTQELCAVCAVSYEIVADAAKRLSGDPRVISLEPSSVDDVFSTIRTLGELTSKRAAARNLVELMESQIAVLRAKTKHLPRPRTLLLEWTDPPMSGGHWAPELVEIAGGEPVLANSGADSQTLTWNAIADADPDVILVAPCGYDLDATRNAIEHFRHQPEWAGLRAVRALRAWAIDGNAYVNRPGTRLIRGAEIFAHAIHERDVRESVPLPEAFARA
jgi:iron complex transport system substrate-binding protein